MKAISKQKQPTQGGSNNNVPKTEQQHAALHISKRQPQEVKLRILRTSSQRTHQLDNKDNAAGVKQTHEAMSATMNIALPKKAWQHGAQKASMITSLETGSETNALALNSQHTMSS